MSTLETTSNGVNFFAKFQTKVGYPDAEHMSIEQLEAAFANVSTAQVDVIDSRVNNIVKSVLKTGQLYIRPVVAIWNETSYLCSGRHRMIAVKKICSEFGINAAGQLVKYDGTMNDNLLTPIVPTIAVEVIYADSFQTVGHLQLEYNGSRSMTQAENNLVKATFAKLSALTSVQMSLARKIENVLGYTFNTCLSIAKTIGSKFPKMFVYSSEEQLDWLVSALSEFVESNVANDEIVPSNMARDYKKLVTAFLASMMETGETDGDGEEIVESVQALYAAGLEKPEKVAKASTKVAELQAKIAELTAALQKAG